MTHGIEAALRRLREDLRIAEVYDRRKCLGVYKCDLRAVLAELDEAVRLLRSKGITVHIDTVAWWRSRDVLLARHPEVS